jgi:hypothetical protein
MHKLPSVHRSYTPLLQEVVCYMPFMCLGGVERRHVKEHVEATHLVRNLQLALQIPDIEDLLDTTRNVWRRQ